MVSGALWFSGITYEVDTILHSKSGANRNEFESIINLWIQMTFSLSVSTLFPLLHIISCGIFNVILQVKSSPPSVFVHRKDPFVRLLWSGVDVILLQIEGHVCLLGCWNIFGQQVVNNCAVYI